MAAVVLAAMVAAAMSVFAQVIVVVAGTEAQAHTALADCATAPYDAAGHAVATQGTTAEEMAA